MLKNGSKMEARTAIEIRRLRHSEASSPLMDQIVALHHATFPTGVLARLGNSFMRDYYTAIVCAPEGHLWIAVREAQVLGFLACTTDRSRFETEHRAGAARRALLIRLLTFRMPPRVILRALRKQRLARGLPQSAELLAIAVSPECRREGIGRRLLQEWHTLLRSPGVSEYLVFTDNEEGYRFYSKSGGQRLFEFRLGGHTSAAFLMKVEPES